MGKRDDAGLSPIKNKEMRHFLTRQGFERAAGKKHVKFTHPQYGWTLLSQSPHKNLPFSAVKQLATAMGMTPKQLIEEVRK